MRAAILAIAVLLAGCDMRPEHAEWQMQCVDSHTDLLPMPQFMPDGRGGGTTIIQLIPVVTCDREVPVCVGGKDGSTRCHDPEGATR